MTSSALTKFECTMLKDVDRIIDTHKSLLTGGKGKKALGHLTRGGVLLLCAAWELFMEELLVEAVKACREKAITPDNLPLPVQKTIAGYVKESKHALKPLALAGDGWKAIYLDIANETVAALNTPKSHNIDKIFHDLLGINELSKCWSIEAKNVNLFVEARGDIAHKGSDSEYVTIAILRDNYKVGICRTAEETDNAVSTHIRDSFDPKSYPWNRRKLN
jgi:RiboL-PSP-HEPN